MWIITKNPDSSDFCLSGLENMKDNPFLFEGQLILKIFKADDENEAKEIYEQVMKDELEADEVEKVIKKLKQNSYNLDKIIKIRVNDFYKSERYTYLKEKRSKWFNRVIRKEGIHQSWAYGEGFLKEVPKNHILKDDVVYKVPEVILYFENDHRYTYYCESLEKAEALRDKIKKMTEPEWLDN